MTLSDYLLDIALIAVVALQVRGRRLSVRSLLIPVGIVAWAAAHYLHGVPTSGNDLVLVGLAAGLGTTLGVLSGLATRVTVDAEGHPFAQAGLVAAVLWVVGVGTRFAFQLYASHGGGPAVERFSAAHGINSMEAWVAALILMAMGEALSRTAIVGLRAFAIAPHARREATIMGTGDRAH